MGILGTLSELKIEFSSILKLFSERDWEIRDEFSWSEGLSGLCLNYKNSLALSNLVVKMAENLPFSVVNCGSVSESTTSGKLLPWFPWRL